MSLSRWSTLASFHRTMILRGCRPSFPFVVGGASIDAGVPFVVAGDASIDAGVWAVWVVWACCSPRARLLIKVWLRMRLGGPSRK